ncbi:hypothetical protein XF24_00868 [candidate division SR1 bacterium Aalborg_AAW-1]|nr:hypothetical protein XF24_00868 [candidate division SR1 bacterium Aalborg_AAW-1]
MSLYHYFAGGKIAVGIIILLSLYILIDPFSDPLIALSGIMIGVFLIAWGGSFFSFLGREKYIRHHKIEDSLITHSYKLSLLFGIYILFNAIFLIRQTWTVLGGIALLGGFIFIQSIVLPNKQSS